ncbi:hypothetical protein KBB96_09005 [Luteolibacter ambystomatis]|uniref:Asl1-like glycosyl hydrolase catalytic domain-containing protein n=1 Tax=Luteolibacter ambystomatis TaxID=2824561 RepID=A0A975J2Z8_9BACT|nr:hypothetical protein [Luteolibacter ambystomatis]QUE53016.1 hypothetical protein KBB96_09005 [Luteolibacter ambystomatis]
MKTLFPFLCLAAGLAHAAPAPRPPMKDFLGLNGHTVQFKPDLYRPVCGVVRDYHPVEWDLGKETSALPKLPMAKNGVPWDKVYGSWKDKQWTIDACLMFESIPREQWKDMPADAKAYGRAFAKQFGPSSATPLLESVEIGNEPGKWSDKDYTTMLRAMAEGIREGDPKLKIATCNLTTGKSGDYEKSVTTIENNLPLVDVLNIHSYAQLENWPTWKRSFPEDPALKKYLPDIEALCKWRDEKCPGKPVWLTEFGYDSTTKPSPTTGDFSKWVGVSDLRQAQWLTRSVLVFSAMPLDRAYVYFFDDKDEPQLHGSSGLTRNFQPKPSFHALSHFQKVLGDYRFSRIVKNEPGKVRLQEYLHATDPKKIVWVIWSPTGEDKSFQQAIPNLPGKLTTIERMPLDEKTVSIPVKTPLTVEVTESPLYLMMER